MRDLDFDNSDRQDVLGLVYDSYLLAVDQLHDLDRFTRDISLSQRLLQSIGVDYHQWPSITVTGSKGKGSASVLTASLLSSLGYRVGLITSPHMRSFNERIRINGQCVSDEELAEAARVVAPYVKVLTKDLTPPQYLGPGGVILALAGIVFQRAGVDAIVVEAGRGGEYDEARLVDADVSVLTPIMLEHPDKLGSTVVEIADTKARIARPGANIITSPQQPDILQVISNVAMEVGCSLLQVGSDAQILRASNGVLGVTCDIAVRGHTFENLHVGLAGLHQAENAAAALLAVSALPQVRRELDGQQAKVALSRVHWPGRAQVLQRDPWVFLDGAINADSARHACAIAVEFPARLVTAVISIPRPKDIHGVCRQVAHLAKRMIVTEVDTPSLSWYPDAMQIASQYCDSVRFIPGANLALGVALDELGSEDGLIALGTQSFVGVALEQWDINTCTLW